MSEVIGVGILGIGAAEALVLLVSVLAKATAILAVAWVLSGFARRRPASLRHGIWAFAVASAVALPIGSRWLPAVEVGVGPLPLAGAPEVVSAQSLSRSRSSMARRQARLRARDAEPRGVFAPVARSVATENTATASTTRTPVAWPELLLTIWGAGVVLRLLWLAGQLWRIRRLGGGARPESDSRAARMARELAGTLGIRRQVRVFQSPRTSLPLTWGIFRPVVLLPVQAREWSEGRLRAVLVHELGHVRRYDYLTSLIGEIACAAYWPIPLVWLARERLREEQEQACDDLVLTTGTAAVEYAEHLLAVAHAFYGDRWRLGATVTMAREVSLKNRIRTILDETVDRGPLLSRTGVFTFVMLTGVVVPVAALRPADDASSRKATAVGPSLPTIWLEAEDAELTSPMQVREDLDASAGGFVVVPDGPGNDEPEGGDGKVRFTFDVPATGEYRIWGRVIGEHVSDNSFYVSVDGGPELLWDIEDDRGRPVRDWVWLPVHDRDSTVAERVPARFSLTRGVHTLQIRNREDGTFLDRIVITADSAYRPSGRGLAVEDLEPIYDWIPVQGSLAGPVENPDDEGLEGASVGLLAGIGSEPGGVASFTFTVNEPGTYVVWGRVLAPSEDANSFYVSLNGGAEVIWDAPREVLRDKAGRWTWAPLNARELGGRRVDPLLLRLEPGSHVLRLRTREAGTRLAGLLVTNDLAFRPHGTWPAVLPTRPARVWVEAEAATVRPPLLIDADGAASAGLYVEVEESVDRWDAPAVDATGSAILRFVVPEPGVYSVWARTLAPDDDHDSFWVRVNGGHWIRWNRLPHGDEWRWSLIRADDRNGEVVQFSLPAGVNVLELAAREGHAGIDRILVTNDPLTVPGTLDDG